MASPLPRHEWLSALLVFAGGLGLLMLWRSAWLLLAWRLSGLHLDLASFQARRAALEAWVAAAPLAHALVFALIYGLVCAFCLPGTLTLVVVAGALFGWWRGALLVLPAAALGSLGAFYASRGLMGPWVRRSFPQVVAQVDAGLAQGGDWFVLTVRLLPISSFSLVNLSLGLSRLSAARFVGLSLLGLLPGSLAYAWAGQDLDRVHSMRDLLSPELWLALLALALLPGLLKLVLAALGRHPGS
jgi:uncharacterized membrane protein YdjX (TVP38/TMEM64 family)